MFAWALTLSVATLVPTSSARANEELARKHACLACHAVDKKVLGPAFLDVAARYAKTPAAVDVIARNIRNGVKGSWGDMTMPAQPQLSEADATALARWVLSTAP